jgi:dinuclear metal center YbgI/SA1388 family protein
MKVQDIVNTLNALAPFRLQESYDNAGLIVGEPEEEVSGILVCLDSTEEVVEEAIEKECNVIVAHHPIVFSGLKSFTGKNYVERTVIQALRNNIAIIAIHTNLDNVFQKGVNQRLAQILDLEDTRILRPMNGQLLKLETYVPVDHTESLLSALGAAGAGSIGEYSNCSFSVNGTGRFEPSQNAQPFVGDKGSLHAEKEDKVEMIFQSTDQVSVLSALFQSHPYEEVAYNVIPLENQHQELGAGAIGRLKEALPVNEFLDELKNRLQLSVLKYTPNAVKTIESVAICGGSGSFLVPDALAAGADILVTSDFKYHQFFDHEDRMILCDIGHYESEAHVIRLLHEELSEKFNTFAVLLTQVNTNPVQYR